MQLRNSERKSFKRCRFRWDLTYNQHLQPVKKGTPLVFGSLVHDALEQWYIPGRERGRPPVETFIDLFNDKKNMMEAKRPGMWDADGEYSEMEELGIAMLTGYVKEFGRDEHIEVIQPEQEFQIDVYHPKTGEYCVTAVGTFDAIIFNHNVDKYGILEHKTWKNVRTQQLQLDEQASTYWALCGPWLQEQGVIGADEDISFMLYNILRKAMPDERPQNKKGQYLNMDGSVSKRQPAPYFHRENIYRDVHDREALILRLCQEAEDIKRVRFGELEVYKNPTWACPFDCDFFDACELHEVGGDWEEYLEMTTEIYEPYEAHEEEATLTLSFPQD